MSIIGTVFRNFIKIFFPIYCLLMGWLLFGQRIDNITSEAYFSRFYLNLNLIPFKTIIEFINVMNNATNINLIKHAVINLIGNIVMFIPLGFCLPCIWNKLRFVKYFIFYVIVIILFIEIIQLFTLLGSCDIDDLILNIWGSTIGYSIFRSMKL